MELLIALLGVTVLLSAVVLLAGFRQRSSEPLEFPPAEPAREPARSLDAAGSGSGWMFGGA